MPSFSVPSVASIKNSLDEVRAQVYPKNETEKKVEEVELEIELKFELIIYIDST